MLRFIKKFIYFYKNERGNKRISFNVNNYLKDYVFSLNDKSVKSLVDFFDNKHNLDKDYRSQQLKDFAEKYNMFVLKRFVNVLEENGVEINDSFHNYSLYTEIKDIELYKKVVFYLNGVNHIKSNNPERIRISDHNALSFKENEEQFLIHKYIPNHLLIEQYARERLKRSKE